MMLQLLVLLINNLIAVIVLEKENDQEH